MPSKKTLNEKKKTREEEKRSERWEKGKTVQQLLWGRATTEEKQYRLSRRVIYNNFCEATHTEKKHKLRSKHLANEVISPMRNNLGLNPHLGPNAATAIMIYSRFEFFTSWISFNHLCKRQMTADP